MNRRRDAAAAGFHSPPDVKPAAAYATSPVSALAENIYSSRWLPLAKEADL